MFFAGQNNFVSEKNKFFHLFPSLTEKRKKKERKAPFSPGVNKPLGVNQRLRVTP